MQGTCSTFYLPQQTRDSAGNKGLKSNACTDHTSCWKWKLQIDRLSSSLSNLSTILTDFLMLHLYLITLAVSPSERLSQYLTPSSHPQKNLCVMIARPHLAPINLSWGWQITHLPSDPKHVPWRHTYSNEKERELSQMPENGMPRPNCAKTLLGNPVRSLTSPSQFPPLPAHLPLPQANEGLILYNVYDIIYLKFSF